MANRFEQSTPPSIHDAYRGLPIGPGGGVPFIYRYRGRHQHRPVGLPWRSILLAARHVVWRLRDVLGRRHSPLMSRRDSLLHPERASEICSQELRP